MGAEAKAGKKGGPSIQCRECSAFFHEVQRRRSGLFAPVVFLVVSGSSPAQGSSLAMGLCRRIIFHLEQYKKMDEHSRDI